jgi:hypothetical protein
MKTNGTGHCAAGALSDYLTDDSRFNPILFSVWPNKTRLKGFYHSSLFPAVAVVISFTPFPANHTQC